LLNDPISVSCSSAGVDGWQTLATKPIDQWIDLAA
jgi:hypothetical protein